MGVLMYRFVIDGHRFSLVYKYKSVHITGTSIFCQSLSDILVVSQIVRGLSVSLRQSVKNLSHTSEISSNCVNVKNPLSHLSTVCFSIMFHCQSMIQLNFFLGPSLSVLSALIQEILKYPVFVSGWASVKKSNSSITEVTSLHGHGSCYHIWFAFVSTKPLLFVAGTSCLASRVKCHEKTVGGPHEEPRTHIREGRDSLPPNLSTHMLRETDFKSSAQTFSIYAVSEDAPLDVSSWGHHNSTVSCESSFGHGLPYST